ncbi:MAG: sulfatase-like hydrolase/transferase, partial [Planctomycetaceae bacterium]|nr:sulfatase-like hydrolase/transferase [Planctomycetaceae bacterium]
MKFSKTLISLVPLLFALSVYCGSTSQLKAQEIAQSPNIILVFIDDMGWGDFSCFGNQAVETQNIDRLAKEGIRFEQFYVNSPICSPSRVAISTGQYPARWKITSYLAHRQLNQRRGMDQWLNPEAPMLARFLQDSGYSTGHFGKWHMGGQRDVGEAPLISKYGFDQSLTNFEGLGPRVLALKDAHNGKKVTAHTLGSDKLGDPSEITYVDRSLVTQSFTQSALQFIKKSES